MKQLDMADLRREWEPLSTAELEAMLQRELERKPPDDEKVILLLHILEDREPKLPLRLTAREEQAWEQYRQKTMGRRRKGKLPIRWLSVAASLVLIVAVLTAVVPQQAEADNFWEMLQRMTNTVLGYFGRDDKFGEMDYHFETENPGLQQVYDAVVELGVKEPVVPMWLPNGFELAEFDTKITPMTKGVWVNFSNGEQEIVYKLDVYDGEPAHQYYKDDTHYESQEWDGTIYQVARNMNRWIVIWTKENTECFLTLECQEETLRQILRSIHVTEAD